jgi:2'-5' RNA ligase
VPAHVTVLYPFVAPEALTEDLITTLAAVVRSVTAFDCRFVRTRWFDQDVLWLEPEPAQPFRQLTAAVWRPFPQHPPYAGAYDDVIPHLTIAEQRLAELPPSSRSSGLCRPDCRSPRALRGPTHHRYSSP